MDTMEKIRKIVNRNRVKFIETLPTVLFIEGFPGLHHFKRERLKCRLTNDGEYAANSDLLDAMLKVDHFPEQFITFCDEHECCTELKELLRSGGSMAAHSNHLLRYFVSQAIENEYFFLRKLEDLRFHEIVLIQSHRCNSAQQNRTITSNNGISAAATITQPSDETPEVTEITQQSCVTNAEAGEMDSGNTCNAQNGQSVSSGTSNEDIDDTRRDSEIEGADNNSLSNKDEVCRALAMDNNMDNNLSPQKPSDRVKAIFDVSTSIVVQATEEKFIGELEGAYEDSDDSSSFYISSIEYVEPVNEIENLKENPSQSPEREESQLLLLSSYTSGNDQSSLKIGGDCSKNFLSQEKSIASHSKAGISNINTKSLVTEPPVIGAQEHVNNYSGVQCQEDVLKIKGIQEPAKNTNLCNSLEEALQNSCPLSAMSETEALSSETELKQFMTESSLDEHFEGETLKENYVSNYTFNPLQEPVIQNPQISVDSTLNSTLDQQQPVVPNPKISVDPAAPNSLTLTVNQNSSADDSEADVFNNQTMPSNAIQLQNNPSDTVSTRVFNAILNFAHFVVRQVLNSF